MPTETNNASKSGPEGTPFSNSGFSGLENVVTKMPVKDLMKYMLALDGVRFQMTVYSPKDITYGLRKREMSKLQSTYDKLNNLEEKVLNELYDAFDLKDEQTGISFDSNEVYDLSESPIQSSLDMLEKMGIIDKVEVPKYDILADRDINHPAYWITKEGVDTLKMSGFYTPDEFLTDAVLRTLDFNKVIKKGRKVHTTKQISTQMKNSKLYDGNAKKINRVMNYLKDKGMIEGTYGQDGIQITDLGVQYCNHIGIEFNTSGNVKKSLGNVKKARPTPKKKDLPYDWNTLKNQIYNEFYKKNDGVDNIPDIPIRFIRADSTFGFVGGVYVSLDGSVFCAGYVSDDGELVPSPELIKTSSAMSDTNDILEYINELNRSAENCLTDLFMNQIIGMAATLKYGTYRDVRELVSKKGNIEPQGQQFLDAAKTLYGMDNLSLTDNGGNTHDIRGSKIDAELLFGADPESTSSHTDIAKKESNSISE